MNVKRLSAAALCFLFLMALSLAGSTDAEFIEIVKNSKASELEKGLPDAAFPLWLEKTFEHGAKVAWEVNDCGEGGDGRAAPVCVEAIIPQQKGYKLHITVIAGDTAGQKISRPQIVMIHFLKSEGYKIRDSIRVDTLSEATRLYKTDLGAKTK